jgi:hypothetical protein
LGVGEGKSARLGSSAMISEVALSRDFPSFWREVTPFMDSFVRKLNRGLYERDWQPMNSAINSARRAFVNEVAFSVLCAGLERFKTNSPQPSELEAVEVAEREVRSARAFSRDNDYEGALSEEEVRDAQEQVRRIARCVSRFGDLKLAVCRPKFPGCGIVDNCEGDIILATALFEIKAGDRPFRSVDLRQVLTYATLNHTSQAYQIDQIGIINPRVGISFVCGLDDLCFQSSGRRAPQLLDAIAYGIASGEVSR